MIKPGDVIMFDEKVYFVKGTEKKSFQSLGEDSEKNRVVLYLSSIEPGVHDTTADIDEVRVYGDMEVAYRALNHLAEATQSYVQFLLVREAEMKLHV